MVQADARVAPASYVMRALPVAALASILLVLLVGYLLGIRVYRITSGSMEPTIHTGQFILTKQVTASELRPGDIVTVQRGPGERLVTHRVIEVTSGALGSDIRLQGDANSSPDPPYRSIDHAQRYLLTLF